MVRAVRRGDVTLFETLMAKRNADMDMKWVSGDVCYSMLGNTGTF